MGDRANVIVKQDAGEAPVVIYSHWGGSFLLSGGIDQAIQKAQSRVGDPHYFTAMLTEALFQEGVVSGIGTVLDDNQHPVMVIDSMTGEREDVSEDEAREILRPHRLEIG